MKVYLGDEIRNIALLGHSSSGKTSLTEGILFRAGAIKRQGSVEDGNTVSDFGKEEITRGVSIGTTVIPVEYQGIKYNILDTPGYFDFIGEMYGAKRASESSILLIDGGAGIQVGSEKAWNNLEKYKTPRFIFINKMDKAGIDFFKLVDELRQVFSKDIIPISLPLNKEGEFKGFIDILLNKKYIYNEKNLEIIEGDDTYKKEIEYYRTVIYEKIAETSEEFLDKYLEGEEFTEEEIKIGIKKSILRGDFIPLLLGSAKKNIGLDFLLNSIKNYLPSPLEIENPVGIYEDKEITKSKEEDENFSAVIFKTIVDPYIGKISLFRVVSGSIGEVSEVYNSTKDEYERPGGIFLIRGKEQIKVKKFMAGDIGGITRLSKTETGDTLCDPEDKIIYERIKYPKPTLHIALRARTREDEDKLGSSLRRLKQEDPTFTVERNKETGQTLLGGQGNMQIRSIIEKLKNTFDVTVDIEPVKVAYRETIRGFSDVQGRHKKQSGGAGQYGDVRIRFEPCEEEFIFEEEVFGGSVPRNFFPAIEKGIEDAKGKGVVAGYPVVNFKAILYDGSHHPVDSNEMSFKIAASMAFKKGIREAEPVLLEPIMKVDIKAPEEYMGEIMGDMNKRRGRILGMEQDSLGNQRVNAEAPHSEMFQYAIDLKAMTQSRGSFQMEFLRYDEVPSEIAKDIIKESTTE